MPSSEAPPSTSPPTQADTPSQPPRIRSTLRTDTRLDPAFYTWSTLFRCLTGNCTPSERESYLTLRDIAHEERDCQRCEKWRDWNFQNSPAVRFMREEINRVGPDLGPEAVRCMRCPFDRKGGFDLGFGILLCANHLTSRKRLEDTLTHEMVHAYDALRWKVQPLNLRHQACTEIRASMLSGECRFMEEWLHRKQFSITGSDGMGQFQECVRRRATLSVAARPNCKSKEEAKGVVAEVWESCFRDTRPFDEIYR